MGTINLGSVLGPQGIPGPKGDSGPANNSYTSLSTFKAQPVTNKVSTLVIDGVGSGDTWVVRDKAGYADAIAVDTNEKYFAISTSDANKVWVRDDRFPVLVDIFYKSTDGTNYAPAWNRALAVARALGRGVNTIQGSSYNLESAVEVWPGALGQTPQIFVDNNRFKLTNVTAGFRYRGIKSGAMANPSFGGMSGKAVIDHNNLDNSSGTRGIAVENGGGVVFDGIDGINVKLGYHILNMRYADGGAVSGVFEAKNFKVSGTTGEIAPTPKWYGFSDTCDLTVEAAGDVVAPSAVATIAMAQTGSASYGMPLPAALIEWTNNTGTPIVVPSTYKEADLLAAGLTKGNPVAPTVAWYASAGVRCAKAIHPNTGKLTNYEVDGGYYGSYVQGVDGYEKTNLKIKNTVRGCAQEWSANNVKILMADIQETLSSGILYGYGCADGNVDMLNWKASMSRWVGEAVINIQLGSPRFTLGRSTFECSDGSTTSGQYYIKFSIGSGDFKVNGPVFIKGDCAKAYVCVESAWNSRISGANPEHYPQSTIYDGAAAVDMAGGLLDNITIEQVGGQSNRGTAISIMQVKDEINGEIGFSSDIIIRRFNTNSRHFRYYMKLYDGLVDAKALINKIQMQDCTFSPEPNTGTVASKYSVPRGWSHFRSLKNVTNFDDEIERPVPNVATPDLTFGKFWWDTGTVALSGIKGAGNLIPSQSYEGREIYVRGNGSRAWTTISGISGTREGLRIVGSPITPTSTERLHLVYSKNVLSWIGGLGGTPRAASVANPTGGDTIDLEARAALDAIIANMKASGQMV